MDLVTGEDIIDPIIKIDEEEKCLSAEELGEWAERIHDPKKGERDVEQDEPERIVKVMKTEMTLKMSL